ncbi:MAG: LytTR family DNA-binding domain-containing protein [Proteobacteria bacterium]|nr:LytTR family DNA-binding domain-containing protein [Pseudomonadota bacterium]MDA1352355.1 LytTR family DNA-binding domain-containing protein [Pseudomonadota bacterium]
MSKLKTIIVDDEPLAINYLRSMLADFEAIDVVAECRNGREAVLAASQINPELMFLDIQMPGMNGFEVIKALQSDVMPMVIFVTAFDQYAVDAFDLHAVDYVLKPFDPERVARAVQRAVDRFNDHQVESYKTPLIGAIGAIVDRASAVAIGEVSTPEPASESIKDKLLVRDSGVVKVIPFDDIDWVDAAGDYMCVHALGETHIIRITLGELMEKLDDKLFIRIHRSTIVNVQRVVSITPLPKGGSLLELSAGETLKVSRNYRESIRNLFR